MAEQLYVQIERGPGAGRRVPVGAGGMTIGREPGSTLILPDLRVSRHHARIAAAPDGGLRITDLTSFNGTLVNGRLVAGDQPLRAGDTIAIGETILRVLAGPALP